MKVVLLGANGQLGSDIRREVETGAYDIELEALVRADIDVADPDAIPAALNGRDFDVLINCTSFHKVDDVESQAQTAALINAHAVRAMARTCADKGARLAHVSTDYVFDGRKTTPYIENDNVGPLNVYGMSKAMGEAMARVAHDDVLVFRVASLFGVAGASGKGGNFVETMIKFGKEKGALRVVADQVMSPTATADVAGMILTTLLAQAAPGTYHAVNSGQASWHQFACAIIEGAGVDATVDPIPASEYPVPAQRPAYSVLDNRKLAAIIGDTPTWQDALTRYLLAKGHQT